MLTEDQRKLFREILDINWEFEHEKDWNKKATLSAQLMMKKNSLKVSMGEEEYDKFIRMGREMFAPKR
jgi:hypothetical protein